MSGLFINKDDESETSSNNSRSSAISITYDVPESEIDTNSQVRYLFVVYVYKHCLLILYL